MNRITPKTYQSPDQIFPFFAVAVGLVCMLAIADLSQLFLFTLVAVAIFFVGIPHGALDVIVIEKYCLKQLPFQSSLLKRVILYGVYLLIVLVCLFFWQSSPFLGLLTFYVLAIGHFQEDWFELNHFLARICLASILLSASVWLYSDNLTSLFMLLGNDQVTAERFILLLKALNSISLISLVFIRAFHLYFKTHIKTTLGIALSAFLLPPLAFFLAYFCAFHSILHTKRIMTDYQLSRFSFICWVSIPMVGTALLAFAFFIMFNNIRAFDENLFSTTFILLFALTVPHMLLTIWSEKSNCL